VKITHFILSEQHTGFEDTLLETANVGVPEVRPLGIANVSWNPALAVEI